MADVWVRLFGQDVSAGTAMDKVGAKAGKTGQQVESMSSRAGNAVRNLGGVIGGEFGSIIDKATSGLNSFSEAGSGVGQKLTAAGGVMTGMGVALQAAGSGEAQAAAQLKAAIDATGNSVGDYKDEIEKAISTNEGYAHSAGDTQQALRVLTQATNDPAKALERMKLVSDLAAASHTSLEEAAGKVAKAMNGNTKLFKLYGIQVESSSAANAKLTTAQRDQQRATAAVEAAQNRLTAARQSETDATTKVTEAQERLTQARETAASEIASADAQVTSAEETLAQAQQDGRQAQQDLTDARAAAKRQLEDLQQQTEDMALSQRDSALSVQEAQDNLNKVMNDPKATMEERERAQLTFDEATQHQRELKRQADDLAKTKADADKKGVEGSDLVVAAQQKISDANRKVNDATRALAAAETSAARARTKAARDIATAQAQVSKAHDAATAAQVKADKAALDLVKAQGEQKASTGEVADAQMEAQKASHSMDDALDQLSQKVSGQASAAVDSFTGRVKVLGTELADTIGQFGNQFGGAVMMAGTALSVFGTVMEMVSARKLASAAASTAMAAAQAAETTVTEVATGATWGLNAAFLASPITWIIAGIIALVAALVLAYQKSGTFRMIVQGAMKAVGAAIGFVVAVAKWVFAFFKDHWRLIAILITGPIGLAAVVIHDNFGKIMGFLSTLWSYVRTVGSTIFKPIMDSWKAVINFMIDTWDWIADKTKSDGVDTGIPGVPKIPAFRLLPHIPHLAHGGIVHARPGGTLALLGEAGHDESVTPLDGAHGPSANINVVVNHPSSARQLMDTIRTGISRGEITRDQWAALAGAHA